MKKKLLLWVKYWITLSALGLLICPAKIKQLALTILISFVLSVFLALKISEENSRKYVHQELIIFDIALLALVARLFYERWIPSSKLLFIALKTGFSSSAVLIGIIIMICLVAIAAVDWIVASILDYSRKFGSLQLFIIILFISVAQFLQLQYSSLESFESILINYPLKALVSIFLISSVHYLIGVLIFPKYGLLLISVFITVWSIANHYVIAFHGSPLYLSELANMKTAMAVMGGYQFAITAAVVFITVFGVLEIAAVYLANDYSSARKDIKTYILTAVLVFVSMYGINRHITSSGSGWSWQDNIRQYGFILSAAKDISVRAEIISKPDSYDSEHLNYDLPKEGTSEDDTDIILILNETFCDLDYYSDIETDIDVFEEFYSIPGSVTGKVIVPAVGGGTNRSEFELLTSKSMNLLPDSAPFLYLNKDIVSRGIVKYLNELGYHTAAMHCSIPENYSRNTVYPAMEFDEILLGGDAFDHCRQNGNRGWLDSDNYRDLIELYEENTESPQFIYLLTMQNHGGWEMNEDRLDTVHISNDYIDLTDDINEYLSSIRLSCAAFKELTDYYTDSDRHVIICMVGDHAPSFIDKLNPNEKNGGITKEITERAVPYIIWSNKDIKIDHYVEYASMTDLMPMILEEAGVRLSAFYTTLLNLHDIYPVRCRYGYTMDTSGNITMYDSENDVYSKIRDYYNLEYNSLMADDEYREDLFMPQ